MYNPSVTQAGLCFYWTSKRYLYFNFMYSFLFVFLKQHVDFSLDFLHFSLSTNLVKTMASICFICANARVGFYFYFCYLPKKKKRQCFSQLLFYLKFKEKKKKKKAVTLSFLSRPLREMHTCQPRTSFGG